MIFYGCFFLGSLALIINFFYPINKIVNNFLIIIGIISFAYYFNEFRKKQDLFYITLFCFFTLLLETTNRPDAGLYHLPFIGVLNSSEIILGLANINTKFGHTSFYQYISSTFYNSIFKDRALFIPIGLMWAASLILFFEIACSKKIENKIKILALFFGSAIAIEMNRFSGFGNDDITHIIFFIMIIYSFHIFSTNDQFEKKNYLNIILILSLLLFLNKTLYAPVIFLVCYIYFKLGFNIFIFNKKYLFLIFILCCWFLKNFLMTGCIIYPINFTCFDNFTWSTNFADKEAIIIEAWAKSYPDQKESYDMSLFIENFNWLPTWSQHHLKLIINKLSIIIAVFLILSFLINFNGKKLKSFKFEKIIIFFISLMIFFWFFKLPLYRFGSGFLITAAALITVYFLNKFNSYYFNIILKTMTTVLLVAILSKNLVRITKKFNQNYNEYPYINIYSENNNKKKNYIEKKFLNSDIKYLTTKDGSCYYVKSLCSYYYDRDFYIQKFFKYKVINK